MLTEQFAVCVGLLQTEVWWKKGNSH